MASCILFCAAEFDAPAQPIHEDDFLIAADGGLRHVQSLGLTPDAVIGDFDSLGYVPEQAVVYPVEKDDTDAMLAVKLGLERGFKRFVIYGGMDGKRLDHTVANFQTLSYLAEHDAFGILVGRDYLACVFKNGRLDFPAGCQGDFSLFCLGRDAVGVSIQGLYYEVVDVTLTSAFPLGVSNHILEPAAVITVRRGALAVGWQLPPIS